MTTARLFALTPGEPAGIGPDLCLLLAREEQPHALIAIASRDLLAERAQALGLKIELIDVAQIPGRPRQRLLAVCMSGIRHWPQRSAPAS